MIFSNFLSSRLRQVKLTSSPSPSLSLSSSPSSQLKTTTTLQNQAPNNSQQLTTNVATTQQHQYQSSSANQTDQRYDEWQLERKFTLGEVQQHSSIEDCWIVIFDKVYDITEFVFEHPGGDFILLEYAGRDATQAFLASRHGSSAYKMLDKYWIGILVDEELCYSNNSSYCSVYSNLSWRKTLTNLSNSPQQQTQQQTQIKPEITATTTTTTSAIAQESNTLLSASENSESSRYSTNTLHTQSSKKNSPTNNITPICLQDNNNNSSSSCSDEENDEDDTLSYVRTSAKSSAIRISNKQTQPFYYNTKTLRSTNRPSRRYLRTPSTTSVQNILTELANTCESPLFIASNSIVGCFDI